MRVIVCGGRDYRDRDTLVRWLAVLPPDTVIVHGECKTGADAIAEDYWRDCLGFETEKHPADWPGQCRDTCKPGHRKRRRDGSEYCPMAGNYRNQAMADLGADWCLAFPGGTGTADMTRRARAAGIPVKVVPG